LLGIIIPLYRNNEKTMEIGERPFSLDLNELSFSQATG
jgi:hypothetical protein